jgi:hypothetical protein
MAILIPSSIIFHVRYRPGTAISQRANSLSTYATAQKIVRYRVCTSQRKILMITFIAEVVAMACDLNMPIIIVFE